MDTRQMEYIIQISEERSITKAAEKLFITQSALNQQLLRLEKELGAPLFHRSKVDMRPTEIGQVYLDNAREILRIKQRTYNLINAAAKCLPMSTRLFTRLIPTSLWNLMN